MNYRHYKGGLYRVLFIAHDSTNGPDCGRSLVIYVSLSTGRINARTEEEFGGMVDGRQRFSPEPIE